MFRCLLHDLDIKPQNLAISKVLKPQNLAIAKVLSGIQILKSGIGPIPGPITGPCWVPFVLCMCLGRGMPLKSILDGMRYSLAEYWLAAMQSGKIGNPPMEIGPGIGVISIGNINQ